MQLRARVLSFTADETPTLDYLDDAVVSVADGHITNVVNAASFSGDLSGCEDLRPGILVPGFIDAHIHFPQQNMVASYGTQLLDWLDRYAFPAEMRYGDAEFAATEAQGFLKRLLSVGTTTAQIFTSTHSASCEALFTAAQQRGMRLIAGKVLMDRNAPEGLRDGEDGGYQASADLIERWHGKDRLHYAITPRFALTSTAAQMDQIQALHAAYPDAYVHSHISENVDEIEATLKAYPWAKDYLNVYEHYDLLSAKTAFAHGIYLTDSEVERVEQSRTRVVFCPTSNLFLGSGLLDIRRFDPNRHTLAVGSDIGGGTSFSMLTTLSEGYKVCQLNGLTWPPIEALYSITLGNARALSLDTHIGRVAAGFEADFCLLEPPAGTLLEQRLNHAQTLEEELFAYMMLGDERAIARTYVAGRQVHGS